MLLDLGLKTLRGFYGTGMVELIEGLVGVSLTCFGARSPKMEKPPHRGDRYKRIWTSSFQSPPSS
jgi:hypothetical protein